MRSTPLVLALALGVGLGSAPLAAQQATAEPSLLDDVKYLTDDRLAGRLIGTAGADSAADFLQRRFVEAGLQASPIGWFQSFAISRDAPAAIRAGVAGRTGRNVIGVLPGRDPKLQNETVIVGAHYDHLGLGEFGSLDPDSSGKIHNGADDNASGATALIHIAERLAKSPPARTIVFIAFSGEELGLLGSSYYVRHPVYQIKHTVAMLNLDMVGRLTNDRLIVYGARTASEFPSLLESLNQSARFDLRAEGDGYGPSDQSSFYAAHVPVLHFFTDLHEDYHRTTDDWDKINVVGMQRVIDFTTEAVATLANRREAPTLVELAAPAYPPLPSGSTPAVVGYGVYLGTIPDMAGGGVKGVRLSGVRKDSPAEKAGLRAEDVIVRLDKTDIPDLQAMADALRAYKPGDKIKITVLRNGKETKVKATLGSRSS